MSNELCEEKVGKHFANSKDEVRRAFGKATTYLNGLGPQTVFLNMVA